MDSKVENAFIGLMRLEAISKGTDISYDIMNVLVNHKCTIGEARELMKGYLSAFDEVIQKDPSKINETIKLSI